MGPLGRAVLTARSGEGGGFAHRVPSTDLKVGLRYQSWEDFYLMMHQRWSRGGGICGLLGQASTFGDDVPVF